MDIRQQMLNTKITLWDDYKDFLELRLETPTVTNNPQLKEQLEREIEKVENNIEQLQNSKNATEFVEKLYGDMPIIPIGKNTDKHSRVNNFKQSSGNDSQIKMSKTISADLKRSDKYVGNTNAAATQVKAIRDAWNGLSDEQRALVGTVDITAVSRKLSTGKGNAGATWNEKTKTLSVMIDNKRDITRTNGVEEMYKRVYHEMAHAEFNKMSRDKPEKVSKFIKTVSSPEMKKTPINSYVADYSNAQKIVDDNWNRHARKYKGLDHKGKPFITKDDETRYRENTKKWEETIYADETHSAVVEIISGTKVVDLPRGMNQVTDPKYKQFFNAYEELMS